MKKLKYNLEEIKEVYAKAETTLEKAENHVIRNSSLAIGIPSAITATGAVFTGASFGGIALATGVVAGSVYGVQCLIHWRRSKRKRKLALTVEELEEIAARPTPCNAERKPEEVTRGRRI